MNLGLNLSSNTDWCSGRYWLDLKNVLRAWGSAATPYDRAAPALTADGYPSADFGGFADLKNYPGGLYRWSFTGDGVLTWLTGVSGPVVFNGGKSGTVVVDGNQPISFRVTGVNAVNPFRGLTIRRAVGNDIFDPDFVSFIKPFRVLRFMDWTHTNYTAVAEWANRPKLTDQQTVFPAAPGRGVALEYCLALATTVGATAWLNVPHTATDDYVNQMAALVSQYRVPILLEISNEVWNSIFPANAHQFAAAGLNPVLTAADRYARMYQHVAWRLYKAVKAFRAAGVDVTGVLAGQAENRWYLESGLEFLKTKYGNAVDTVGALAYADYFWTDDDWAAGKTGDLTRSGNWVAVHRGLADRYGIPRLAAYEAGQHLTGNRGSEPQKRTAQSSQIMKDSYTAAMKLFEAGAGPDSVYCPFASPDTWNGATGYWGLSEGLGKSCPKLDAVLAYLNVAPPPVPPPTPVPAAGFTGTLTYRDGKLTEVHPG